MGKQLKEEDAKFKVHRAYWAQAAESAEIHIIENVTEYQLEDYVQRFLGPTWECFAAKVDPRLWGFATSRPRVYGIAWNTSKLEQDVNFPFEQVIEALRARPVMTAADFAWMSLPKSRLPPGQATWTSCSFKSVSVPRMPI